MRVHDRMDSAFMSYSLADLPLMRINRKKGLLWFSGIVGFIFWALTVGLLQVNQWDLSRIFASRSWPQMIFWDAGSIFIFVNTLRRHSKLLIDEAGVHITTNGTTRNYRWDDIQRTRQVVVNARSGAKVTQIVRKGQIIMDNKSDLIWGEFGLSNDDLASIISEGCKKWSGAGDHQASGVPVPLIPAAVDDPPQRLS